MNNCHKFVSTILTVFSAVPVAAQAQASPDANAQSTAESGLGDIVVTAQRREESAQKVSISMTVVGEDEIRSKLKSGTDIAKLVPNIQLESPVGFGIPRTGIRGITQSDFNANATTSNMVYLDDIPLNATLAQGVPLWDVARAEVLRGPQGTLFGRNATGGAIRFIVSTPGNSAEGYAGGTAAEFGYREARAGYGGPITDNLGVRVSFVAASRNGDYRNVTLNQTEGAKENYGARIVAAWAPIDAIKLTLRAQYFWSDQNIYTWKSTPGLTTFVGFGPAPPIVNGYTSVADIQAAYGFQNLGPQSHYRLAEADTEGRERLKHLPISATLDFDLGPATLTSVTGFLDIHHQSLVDLDSSPAPFLTEHNRHKLRQWTQEVRLTSTNDGPFSWILGAFYMKERIEANQTWNATAWIGNVSYGYPNAKSVLYNRGYNQETESYAFFAHGSYDLTDELKLSAAARWTKEMKDIDYKFRSYWEFPTLAQRLDSVALASDFLKAVESGNLGTLLGAAEAPLSGHKSWSEPTWKIALDYQVTPETLLYAFVARGFKGGSFVPSANTRSQVLLPDGRIRTVNPETVVDYEAGVKSDLIPGRLRVNASAFYYDYRGYQTNQFVQATQILTNLPKAEAYGGEIEVNWNPVRDLRVNVGGGILRSKILKALDPALVGNKLPQGQDANVNASISYRIDTPVGTFTPELSGKYRGKFYPTKENEKKIGGDTTLDFRVDYRSKGEKFYGSLWVRNLTNNIFPVVQSDQAEFFGSDFTYINERRTLGATFGVKF